MEEFWQLIIIAFGVVAGGFFGVEYGNWRVGRRIKNYEKMLFNIVGLGDYEEFSKLKPQDQKAVVKSWVKETLVPALKKHYELFFPDLKLPKPPPSKIKLMNGRNFYVPHCPQCGFAAAPVYDVVYGVLVEASCPTHGTYKQRVPETKEKENKKG